MKKINIVRHNRDFSTIINKGTKYRNEIMSIYKLRNEYGNYRIGITVSKKHGNAVFRNKVKRQMRNICDKYKNLYQNDMDYIIIVGRNYVNYSFHQINEKYEMLLNKISTTEGEKNEKK